MSASCIQSNIAIRTPHRLAFSRHGLTKWCQYNSLRGLRRWAPCLARDPIDEISQSHSSHSVLHFHPHIDL